LEQLLSRESEHSFEAGRVFAQFVQEVVSSPVGQLLGDIFNQVAGATKNFITVLTQLLSVFVQIISPVAELLRAFSPLVGVLVVFIATVKTASLTLTVFNAIQKATQSTAGGTATALQSGAGAIAKFGTAIKSLLALDLKGFFTNLAGSAVDFTRALVGGDITKLTTAFRNISGAGQATGKTLQSLVANVNNVSAAAGVVAPAIAGVGASAGTATPILGGLASSTRDNYGEHWRSRSRDHHRRPCYRRSGCYCRNNNSNPKWLVFTARCCFRWRHCGNTCA